MLPAAATLDSQMKTGMTKNVMLLSSSESGLVSIFNPGTPMAQNVVVLPGAAPNSVTFSGPYGATATALRKRRYWAAPRFGDYAANAGDIDVTSTISVRCSTGTPYGIGLSAGTGTGSTIAQRLLTSVTVVGSALQFNLYTNAGRTVVWDNLTTAGAVVGNQGGVGAGLGMPNSISHTVYGRLQDSATSRTAAPASDYTSTITVTINY